MTRVPDRSKYDGVTLPSLRSLAEAMGAGIDHVCNFDAWFTTSTHRRGPYCATCFAKAPDFHGRRLTKEPTQ